MASIRNTIDKIQFMLTHYVHLLLKTVAQDKHHHLCYIWNKQGKQPSVCLCWYFQRGLTEERIVPLTMGTTTSCETE